MPQSGKSFKIVKGKDGMPKICCPDSGSPLDWEQTRSTFGTLLGTRDEPCEEYFINIGRNTTGALCAVPVNS
jgi:hypothetical protein